MSNYSLDIYGSNYVTWTHSTGCIYNDKSGKYTNNYDYLTNRNNICAKCVNVLLSDSIKLNYILKPGSTYSFIYYLCMYGADGAITVDYCTSSLSTFYELGSSSTKTIKCNGALDLGETMNGMAISALTCTGTFSYPTLISNAVVCICLCGVCNNFDTITPFYGNGVPHYCYCLRFDLFTNCGDESAKCIAYFTQMT